MAKTSKTTKSTESPSESLKKPAVKKPAAASEETPKKAAAKKPAAKKTAGRKSSIDPGEQLLKATQEAAAKFQKMGNNGEYNEIREKLEWCIGSYNYDKNPEGLVEYGKKASEILKAEREKNPKSVSKKVVDDLEKALARF
ncbi:MAG: hypothetical protein ACLFUB_10640 [Cyclobacteriaceae bacterium]